MGPKGGGVPVKQRRYLCPQCFTSHFWNDVLFASRRSAARYDPRQAARRRELWKEEDFLRWCRAGKNPVLLNWRTLPEERRQWRDGAVTAVRDMDGTWLTQRVCPCCHGPLPAQPFPVVVGWQQDGYSSALPAELLQAAAQGGSGRWTLERDEDAAVRCCRLTGPDGATVLGVPLLPAGERRGYAANCVDRCCGLAQGAVLRLRVEPDDGGGLDVQAAQEALWGFQDACGCTAPGRKLAVVCLLEGVEDPEGAQRLRRACPSLVQEITYSFENSYFAVGADRDPRAAVQAAEWLSRHAGGLSGEGAYG